MDEIISDLVRWSQLQPAWAIYLAILAVSYIENVVPPIPGDLLVVFGGYLASTGMLDVPAVVLLATIGGTAGFMTMYELGRRLGGAVLKEHRFRWIPHKRVRRSMEWFQRFGYGLILANRFLSGLRSVISLTVGMARTRPWRTLIHSAISSLAWVVLLAYAGYALGENWELIRGYLNRYGQVILVLVGVFVVVQMVRYWLNVRNGDDDEVIEDPADPLEPS